MVTGFEMLESLSEDLMAGENLVNAETPFSPQLSICYWFNPKHLAYKTADIELGEIRTPSTKNDKAKPSNTNWPNFSFFIGKDGVYIQDQAHGKLEQMPLINYLQKWTRLCFSIDFPANEAKIAMNGKLIGKFKDPETNEIYENQFGGKSILQETKDSKFFFTFGRYFFDDVRHVLSYAGINAWNRSLSDEEMTSLSQCETVEEELKGNKNEKSLGCSDTVCSIN